jgi:hypothetical protein
MIHVFSHNLCYFIVMYDNLIEAPGKDSASTPATDVRSSDKLVGKSGREEPGDHFDSPAPIHHLSFLSSKSSSSSCLKCCWVL